MTIRNIKVDRNLIRITTAYRKIADYFYGCYSDSDECIKDYWKVAGIFRSEARDLSDHIIDGAFKDQASSDKVYEDFSAGIDLIEADNDNAYILDDLRSVSALIIEMSVNE